MTNGDNMIRPRRYALVLAAALLAYASPVAAQDSDTFTIVVEGVLTGAEGDVAEVVNQPVAAALVGETCTVTGQSENNGSVHPGNNLIIATGSSSTTVAGTEDTPGQIVNGTGSVVLGESVVVSVEFGPDGVTSGGVTLTFACQPALPEGGVDKGAGGTAGDSQNAVLPAVGLAALALAGALVFWRRRSISA
jgi:LPXTG-motif cell wall-anchored protein